MNRNAAGVGPWLLRETSPSARVSLDAQQALIDRQSFTRWLAQDADSEGGAEYTALLALLREIWRDELSERERAILQGLHLEGKKEAALAREMGVHHSAVGRLRRRGEQKLRGGLGYVLRYQALVASALAREHTNS